MNDMSEHNTEIPSISTPAPEGTSSSHNASASDTEMPEISAEMTLMLSAIEDERLLDQDELTSVTEILKRDEEPLTLRLPSIEDEEPLTLILPSIEKEWHFHQNLFQPRFFTGPLSLPGMESYSIADEQTWLLPAIPKWSGQGTREKTSPDSTEDTRQPGADSQGYLALALNMVKSSGIYALGAFVSPLVSLILTPFLTNNLSSSNYGGLAVLYIVIDLVSTITQLGLSVAFFRAYNGDYESAKDRSGVLLACIILLALVSIPVTALMIFAAPWISAFLFESSSFIEPVRITALVLLWNNLSLPGISWLRAEDRPVLYSILSVINLLLILSATIVLVGILHLGVDGALLAKGAGFAITTLCTVPMMLVMIIRNRSLLLRLDIVRNLLSFGVPTLFSDVAAWILQLSDRYLLSIFKSLTQTASYSVAYVLGGVLSPVVLAPFGLAWVPVMYTISKRKDAAYVFRLVFHWFSILLLFATFALSLLSTIILETLFPPGYRSAELVIPIVAVSTMLIGINYIFMTGVYIQRKTGYSVIFTVTAASVNILFNLVLIPRFGMIGAAVSTLLAYIILIFVSYNVNQKIYPVKYEVGLFLIELFIGVALYVASSLLAHSRTRFINWGIFAVALLIYGFFLLLLGGVSVKKIKTAVGYIRKALRR